MSDDFITKQENIVTEKINKGLVILQEQLNTIDFKCFPYINNVYSFVNHLNREQKQEIINYIFDTFNKDIGVYTYNGITYNSFYTAITFRLQHHFEKRSIEFDNLCQTFLDSHFDDYKFLPTFQ